MLLKVCTEILEEKFLNPFKFLLYIFDYLFILGLLIMWKIMGQVPVIMVNSLFILGLRVRSHSGAWSSLVVLTFRPKL